MPLASVNGRRLRAAQTQNQIEEQINMTTTTLGGYALTTNDTDATNPFLLVRIKDHEDTEAWNEFIETYRPLVRGYCVNRGIQSADADDIAQEVMKSVSQSISTFEYDSRKGRFRSWLFAVARSKVSNHVRSRERQPQTSGGTEMMRRVEAEPAPEDSVLWDEEFEQLTLQKACESIRKEFSATTWMAFWATAMEHRSGEAVARDYGMTLSAVYTARSRVTARMKEWVRRFLREDPDFVRDIWINSRPHC